MLTQCRLRELLSYDPDRGIFVWRVKAARNTIIGSEAGRISSGGYREIGVGGRLYFAHRLAWLYVHGEWPSKVIGLASAEIPLAFLFPKAAA